VLGEFLYGASRSDFHQRLTLSDNVQLTTSRWSVVVAVFAAVCNLLCLALLNYESFFLRQERFFLSNGLIVIEGLSLAPLLALFVFRRYELLVSLHALALFSILMGHVDRLVQYRNFGEVALVSKIDSLAVLSMLLGAVSVTVVVVWGAIRWVAFILNAPKEP
jgi:hypothetical protein